MKRRIFFFLLVFVISFNPPIYAGWPEDGWEGVPSLNIVHHEVPIDFDTHHIKLAQLEKEVSATLPSGTATNIVFATISILNNKGFHPTFIVGGPSAKPYAFESGWSSVLNNPVLEEVQSAIRPFASQLLKSEGLPTQDKEKLLGTCREITHKQELYEQTISRFHFQDNRPAIQYILGQTEETFLGLGEKEPGYPVYQEFKKDKEAWEREGNKLEKIKQEASSKLLALSQKVNPADLNDELLGIFEETAKGHRTDLFKQNKVISNIGSKIVATYWHSEQRFLHHIKTQTSAILEYLLKNNIPVDAIMINIHSRYDICPVCSHTLARSYTTPNGILTGFKKDLCAKLGVTNIPFYLTGSFREERTKSSYKVGQHVLKTLEDFGKLNPAFPVLYIPLK